MACFDIISQYFFKKTEEQLEEVGSLWNYSQIWNLSIWSICIISHSAVTSSLCS